MPSPRRIIELMVDMTAPSTKYVICGTAGFLVAASAYLNKHHSDAVYKDANTRKRFNSGTFHGFDFGNTMLRIGSINMILHVIESPDFWHKDSLAQAVDGD